ncbi:MAG: DUF4340 domain-containing protein [bacterium]|nr:DUF4340 domain-containing protein [bacterium]
MRFKTTIISLIVLLVFGGAIYWYEFRGAPERKKAKTQAERVFSGDFLTVNSIAIEKSDGRVRVFRKSPEEWEIVEPLHTEADNGAVKSLVNRLQGLEFRRVVDENPADLEKYGLSHPEIRVEFSGGANADTIELGNRGPIGSTLYLKKKSSPRVFLVDSSLKSLVNKGLLDLRERRIISVERNQVEGIDLVYPDRELQLELKDLKWKITKPAAFPADESEINQILTELINLKADRFIAEKLEDPAPYGFNRPRLLVTLALKDKKTAAFRIGANAEGGVYANRVGGDPVYLLDSQVLDKLTRNVNDFRDKTVINIERDALTALEFARPGTATVRMEKRTEDLWRVSYPFSLDVDRFTLGNLFNEIRRATARDFVTDHPENLKRYGLDSPRLKVSFFGPNNKQINSLVIGKESSSEETFAKTDAPTIYKIESARVNVILNKLQDVLAGKTMPPPMFPAPKPGPAAKP